MPLYLYAVVRAALPGIRLSGLMGRDVRRIRWRELAAMASPIPASPLPDEDNLRTHQEVLDQLFAKGTVVPLPFGTLAAGTGDARRMLREREDALIRTLMFLDGQAEMHLHAVLVEPEGPQAPLMGASIHRFIMAEAGEGVVSEDGRGRIVLGAAYLVPVDKIARFVERCRLARDTWPDCAFVVTGPWPPVVFAGEMLE